MSNGEGLKAPRLEIVIVEAHRALVRLAERAAGPAFLAEADRLFAHRADADINPCLFMLVVAVSGKAADAEVRLKLGILLDFDGGQR